MAFKMLIAEDELNEYELVLFLLEKQGILDRFDIFHASNGNEAIEYIDNNTVDVLLTDIEMPFTNGLQLASKARLDNPNLPIIFFSCYDNFSYAKHALSLKATNYLLKPLDPEEFKQTMTDILDLLKKNQKYNDVTETKLETTTHAISIIKQYIETHYMDDISLNSLSELVYLNTSYISALFKSETGYGLNKYIKIIRMEKAKEFLLQTNMKINDIGAKVGFHNDSYFIKSFHEYFGMTPETMRQKGSC